MAAQTETVFGESLAARPERFVPAEMRGRLIEAEHLARYRWASSLCRDRRVLDAGCGTGYGAELLSQAGAREVVGVDVSETAIALANEAVGPGVVCEVGDLSQLVYADGSFDVIVCFEVIGTSDRGNAILDELARVLRPDGLLLLSTPNRGSSLPGDTPAVHELSRAELQAALDLRFASSRIISQHVMLASVISWSTAPLPEQPDTERCAKPAADDELTLIAMAGTELPPDPGPLVALSLFAEPRRWLEHIERQRDSIDRQSRRIEELAGRDADRVAALERLVTAEQELASSRSAKRQLEDARQDAIVVAARLEDLTAREAALIGRVAELERQLDAVRASKSWQMTAPLRRMRS